MLEARNVSFKFSKKGPLILNNRSLQVRSGEIVGVAGVSGSGKSTFGRILANHLTPSAGRVFVDGNDNCGRGFNPVQFLHQSPALAINPRWSIRRIIEESGVVDPAFRDRLGVKEHWYDRFPHELSGGELQRVIILRALDRRARYLIADEITSMLDPIAQSEIWHALIEICREQNIGLLAISHDLHLLHRITERIIQL
ncbi:MAG: ABC transporter ATP-binding protein [Phyllobacterium sp.]